MISCLHCYVFSFLAAFLQFILPSSLPVMSIQPAEPHKVTRPKGMPWCSPMWNAMVADTTLISAFSVKHDIFLNVAFVYLKHGRNRSKGRAGQCPLAMYVLSNELHIYVSQIYTENWNSPIGPRWREVAVPVLWPVPEAAVTVFSTPDDGCCDTRNM